MPDVRLIDANALLKRIAHHTVHDSLKRITFEAANTYEQVKGDMFNLVQKAPTIDAVPVVRCRDCVLRGSDYCPMCHDEYTYDEDDGSDYYTVDNTDDDGFCHQGKREV